MAVHDNVAVVVPGNVIAGIAGHVRPVWGVTVKDTEPVSPPVAAAVIVDIPATLGVVFTVVGFADNVRVGGNILVT